MAKRIWLIAGLVPVLVALLVTPAQAASSPVIASVAARGLPVEVVGGYGAVWAAEIGKASYVQRIDPATNRVTATVSLGLGQVIGDDVVGAPLAVGSGGVWVTDYWRNLLLRIDPVAARVVARISVGRSPTAVVATSGQVYVLNANDGTLDRINPSTNRIEARARVFPGPREADVAFPHMTVFRGALWVALSLTQQVLQIDPQTLAVTHVESVAPAAACGPVRPAPGGFWIDDSDCGSPLISRYSLTSHRIVAQVNTQPGCLVGTVVRAGYLYDAQSRTTTGAPNYACLGGQVVKRDIRTGRPVAVEHVYGVGVAWTLGYAAGSFWTARYTDNELLRLRDF